jgi:hypothetical protein
MAVRRRREASRHARLAIWNFQPVYGLISHAPGRIFYNRARAPAASIIVEPRGRCSWIYGSLFRMSGTGS